MKPKLEKKKKKVCSFFSGHPPQPTCAPAPNCSCSFTCNPSMLPLNLLPSPLCHEVLLFPEWLLHLQAVSTAKELLRQGEDIYSAAQRATECENIGQSNQACFLHFLWKGSSSTRVCNTSRKQVLISGDKKPYYAICQSVKTEQWQMLRRRGVPCMDSCPEVLLGLVAKWRGQAFTLKRISVHIAFPCVIIGSWSSPFPSQQSSSTHLKTQEKYHLS